MTKFSPALKGLLTAILMIIGDLLLFRYQGNADYGIQYLEHIILLAGLAWTLYPFRKSFGSLFSLGFRHFIVVTILMVAFKFTIVKTHPELAEQEKAGVILELQKKGDQTPADIAEKSEKAKKQFPLSVVSISIFGYLIIGAAYTAVSAAVFSRRK